MRVVLIFALLKALRNLLARESPPAQNAQSAKRCDLSRVCGFANPPSAATTPDLRRYSSIGFHSSWVQIHASGSSTLKNTSVGSSGPS